MGDTLTAAEVTALENGKTYVLGKQYDMCKVSFTAPADGFLSITPSQKVNNTSLKINGASSTFTKVNGGIEKKGMAKGSVFEGTFYTSGTPSADNTYALVVTFEEGTPYEPLTMTLANPAQGGEWSGAAQYKTYGTKGVPHFEFSSIISTDVVATVTIGEKVYSPIECTVDGYNPKLDITGMPATMNEAIAAGLLKAGDSFTLTLSGIVDKEFTANTLKDTTFTYTLASTACTGVTPAASTSRTVLPEEVVFSFDGNVKIDNAKFYFVDKNGDKKTELTEAVVEGTSVKITVPALEGMLPKLYDIVAEGVTDENGKVITYGETAGQLTVSYGTGNSYFKPVMEPANYAEVSILKTFTATLPGAVVYDESQASSTKMMVSQFEGNSGWVEMENISVSYEINENVITFTLSEEITTPGDYRFEVPGKLFWSKDLYEKGNFSTSTCYYMASQYITCTILPYGPTTVTPASGTTVNQLGEITLTFDERVDCDEDVEVAVLKQTINEDDWWGTVQLDTIAKVYLEYSYVNDNEIIINVGNIDSVGTYAIVVPEGSIWASANESKKIGEWTFTYDVDPDYWDPEWVVEVGANCTKEAPCQLIAGRKYSFTEMTSYTTFTATENGRLYFTLVDGKGGYTLRLANEEWERICDFSKTADGAFWIGVEAGKTYNITNYSTYSRVLEVTFEAGAPYEQLQFTGTFPAAGGQYSASVEAPESWEEGAVEFYFSTEVAKEDLGVYVVLPSLNNKEIDLSEDAQIYMGAIEWGEEPSYVAVVLGDLIGEIKSTYGLKAGDKIQVVLKNVHDIKFENNKLETDPMVELTLAATVCTSVNPTPQYSVESVPTELSLRFDGNVTCTNGKGRIIDVKSGDVQEFAIENFACEFQDTPWATYYEGTIVLPKLEKEITGKQFRIEIEGLTDAEGNLVSYGDEIGKFVLDYRFSDAAFNYVSADPEDGSELTSVKTTKLTFGDEVHIGPNAYAYFYYGDYNEVTGEFAVDPADPKSVIITWSEEITQPGRYNINIDEGSIYDGGYDETKDDLGLADGAYYNPGIYLEYLIPADLSATTVVSVSPEPYSYWGGAIEKLPAQAVIEFEGNVKEILSVTGVASVGGGWAMDDEEVEEPVAIALDYTLEGNTLTVTLPADEVASMSFGSYTITVNAVGEDGKPIGYALDQWGDLNLFGEYISFSYQVQKLLKITDCTPADFSTVKELSTVTLTFSEELASYGMWSDTPCLLNSNDDSKVADFTYTISGNQLVLTLNEPVTALGSYAAYIPAYALASVTGLENDEDIYVFIDVDPNYVAQEPLAIVSATPENGATVASLTTVEFKLNKEVGYLYPLMLIPADGGDDAAQASLVKSESDPTVYALDFTIGGFLADGAVLRKGVTYTIELEAYASEEASFMGGACERISLTYVGDAEAFQYSDVTFEGITPAEDFVITDKSQNKFTVKFSGAVEMVDDYTFINLGQGATEKFASIEANADKTEYTLTIAESLLAMLRNEVYIVFAANDLNGKRVQGNNGEEEFSCFAYSFKTVIGVPDLTVTPDAAVEQASLSVFSIKCAEGLAPSWMANITLTDANGNAIALNDPEAVVAEGASEWDTPTEWTVALQEELTAVGTYTLTIPAGCFNLGSTQGQVMGNKETVVVFNITAEAQGIKAVTADTEVKVYNVAGVAVAQGKAAEVLKNLTKGIYIVNGKKYVVK